MDYMLCNLMLVIIQHVFSLTKDLFIAGVITMDVLEMDILGIPIYPVKFLPFNDKIVKIKVGFLIHALYHNEATVLLGP